MSFWGRFTRWARKPFQGRPRMLTCQELVDLLVDYLDGALDPETTRALEQHLEGCTACHNFIKTYKITSAWVRETAYVEMPEELKGRLASFLRAKIRQEKASGDQR